VSGKRYRHPPTQEPKARQHHSLGRTGVPDERTCSLGWRSPRKTTRVEDATILPKAGAQAQPKRLNCLPLCPNQTPLWQDRLARPAAHNPGSSFMCNASPPSVNGFRIRHRLPSFGAIQMSRKIRFFYAASGFVCWVAVILLRLIYLTIFSHHAPVQYHPRMTVIAVFWGIICCSPLFRSTIDTARRARKNSSRPIPIARLYLTVTRTRTIRLIVGLGTFSITLALQSDVRTSGLVGFIWISALVCTLSLLRYLLINYRIKSGAFGDTASEARELLAFLSKLIEHPDKRLSPPGPMPPTQSGEHSPVNVSGAEFAL